MPSNLKKRIRARRSKTGETHQAALRNLRGQDHKAPNIRDLNPHFDPTFDTPFWEKWRPMEIVLDHLPKGVVPTYSKTPDEAFYIVCLDESAFGRPSVAEIKTPIHTIIPLYAGAFTRSDLEPVFDTLKELGCHRVVLAWNETSIGIVGWGQITSGLFPHTIVGAKPCPECGVIDPPGGGHKHATKSSGPDDKQAASYDSSTIAKHRMACLAMYERAIEECIRAERERSSHGERATVTSVTAEVTFTFNDGKRIVSKPRLDLTRDPWAQFRGPKAYRLENEEAVQREMASWSKDPDYSVFAEMSKIKVERLNSSNAGRFPEITREVRKHRATAFRCNKPKELLLGVGYTAEDGVKHVFYIPLVLIIKREAGWTTEDRDWHLALPEVEPV